MSQQGEINMAIDEVPRQDPHPQGSGHTAKFVAIFVVLAALAVGLFLTFSHVSTVRGSLEAQQAAMQKNLSAQIDQQFSTRMAALESSNAQQLEAVRKEIDNASKRTGSTGRELKKARAMVEKLQVDQQQQADQLKQELARKADQQQVGALSQDVSATRSDLDSTKKVLESTRADLGMARSEFGTLIARNHDEIETLRKLGERDYFEFTLARNTLARVAGVGLTLKKTNVKRHRFNFVLEADDMQIEKKDRTVNEPMFFYIGGSKRPYELVVNKVQSNQVTGYVSAPKGTVQVATR
jgi:multidrug efflux pump subunit AcrA (membrane-fusion protein)